MNKPFTLDTVKSFHFSGPIFVHCQKLVWAEILWNDQCTVQKCIRNKEKTVLFDKDVNKWAMGSHEIRENCSTMNSNDTTVPHYFHRVYYTTCN